MEVDLLVDYPKIKRDTSTRAQEKSEEQRAIARLYDWRYFDMKVPRICYGGYIYDGRWIPVTKRFIEYYNLGDGDKILDCGMAKGYMLYDFKQHNNNLKLYGMDISEYAVNCCPEGIVAIQANVNNIPYSDKSFDLVICINTIHNLKEDECRRAVREIQRIGKKTFITVDAYSNEEEKKRMLEWNITAETIHSVEEWKQLFKEEGYTGDFYWFIP
jgi:2-polyprenyl-3-methyl-5-hydroxy-6-metoxy-1,4-benzoquinol methylase